MRVSNSAIELAEKYPFVNTLLQRVKRDQSTFIVFEGLDGSGKTTAVRTLSKILTDVGFDVLATREPGGTPLAEKIRTLCMENEMSPLVELSLMVAARVEHTQNLILPALAEPGKIVLCDRYVRSSAIYQSEHLDGDERTERIKLIALAHAPYIEEGLIPAPHFEFVLNIDYKTMIDRLHLSDQINRFDIYQHSEDSRERYKNRLAAFTESSRIYSDLAEYIPNWNALHQCRIQATGSMDSVIDAILTSKKLALTLC